VDVGTHTIFIADVTDCDVMNEKESVTYEYYQRHIKPAPPMSQIKGWICTVCGYRYEGEELPPDYVCPVCNHGAQYFVREE
jgi:rubrerythrin